METWRDNNFRMYENAMTRFDIEEIILSMADIVYENRELRHELKKAQEYEKMYHDLLEQNLQNAKESSANLLSAILMGAFRTNTEE